jgi:hypothetical protein
MHDFGLRAAAVRVSHLFSRATILKAGAMAALVASGAAYASGAQKVPAGLEAARTALAVAVAAHDVKRIVAVSGFPIAVEMYGAAPTITAGRFLTDKRNFDELFGPPDAGIVQCIRTATAVRQDDAKAFGHGFWFVDCNGNDYFFTARQNRWLFVGYENINE